MCKIDGCTRSHYGKGLCKLHYDRLRRHGTTEDPVIVNFFNKVDKTDSCWLWTGATHTNGYGAFFFKGRQTVAHRAAYMLFVGPIPTGLHLDHLCGIRNCVNPDHLEPVTQAENNRRRKPICSVCRQLILDSKLQTISKNLLPPSIETQSNELDQPTLFEQHHQL